MKTTSCDVLILGGGSAGLWAAYSCAQKNPEAKIVIVDKGPRDWGGLMTMAPEGASESVLNQVFGGLARWRNDLEQSLGRPLPELSMGMSGDFPAAIRNGATLVRIGTAIFGSRLLSFPREKKVSKEKRSTFGG